ncbi:peptidoglycan DD-metalloendopeptidase family protein [Pleionea sp. CnH1-48]|uniref:peptidoglycan DD-metalloendopeptidase family protein n=1 Tax=Pleionea sp. CnH1-48 TaxID=2954494 RepID=UPI002097523F|nr:peptidoglycan DD-metalloendopeptidase family protein [Pleionea sp. CnH1-48]MCO7226371.1 peptidoglycan DD-metalloendopeptidase family protein [Pleionea sp. CnH1-48]
MSIYNQNRRAILASAMSSLLLLGVTGCSHKSPAPVIHLSSSYQSSELDRESHQGKQKHYKNKDIHRVRRGDTLYSIAWRYGLDYRFIAKINKIDSDYQIYPGQELFLAKQQSGASIANFNEHDLRNSVLSALGVKTTPKVATKQPKTKALKVSKNSPSKTKAVENSIKKSALYTKNKKNSRQATSRSVNPEPDARKIRKWLWPTKGELLSRFSPKAGGNKGLDISGKDGEPVRAAAPGRVVYSGGALKGYGNLIIVKHNEDFLSAYAHNSKIHVKENELVKAGQVIADIGRSGTDQSKLHFEIRFRGKPVNPLTYLPKL